MVNYKHFVPSKSTNTGIRGLNANLIRWSYQLMNYLKQQITDIGTSIGLNAAGIVENRVVINGLVDSIVTDENSEVVVDESTGNVVCIDIDE